MAKPLASGYARVETAERRDGASRHDVYLLTLRAEEGKEAVSVAVPLSKQGAPVAEGGRVRVDVYRDSHADADALAEAGAGLEYFFAARAEALSPSFLSAGGLPMKRCPPATKPTDGAAACWFDAAASAAARDGSVVVAFAKEERAAKRTRKRAA